MTIAKKSYGQHFLHEASVIEKIITAAEIAPGDVVVEAGPGRGALTEKIAELTNPILIEADGDLIPELTAKYPEATIIHADAAQVDYDDITQNNRPLDPSLSLRVGSKLSSDSEPPLPPPTSSTPWVFISNLPYNAGNAIVMQVLTAKHPPKHLVIMVQKEVGERMLGVKGAESVLTVATNLYARVERVCKVAPGAFTPPPKVDSVVLKLIPYASAIDREKVIGLAKIGFHNRRKQLHRNLSEEGIASSEKIKEFLSGFGLSALARAEELSLENWIKLSEML